MLFVEIDSFKALNAAWGDDLGNRALQEASRRLSGLVRSADTVARVGNDQFVLLVDGLAGIEAAGQLAGRIASALASPVLAGGHEARLNASIGIVLYPADGACERLVSNADAAAASVKQDGGNGYRFFDTRMNAEARSQAELLEDLGAAARRRELELHYQPKIDAHSGQVAGVEALVRWRRPGHGLVSPALFIPLAERAGLINELGSWVIAETCKQMRAWREAGVHMRVAINLSVHQLRQPGLAEEIAGALSSAGVDPAVLTCEITESVAMDDAPTALAVFDRLKATGVQLSIDDFGTGYSSLSYLRRLPVHQLKIDRSFVIDLGESEDARAVAAAIVNLAHALRLEVVAEGVETAAQRDILLALGCDKFQGFLFAKPMSVEAFMAWVSNRQQSQDAFRPSIFALA